MSLLLALVCLLCPLSARAQSDRQAVEIIERLKSRANQVRSFQGLVQLQRLDPDFLGQFYPPNPMYLNTNVRGILNYKAVDSFNLYLTQQAERYYQFQARGGRSLSYLTEVTIPGNINEGIARPTAAPKVDPFGQPVFPTPVASPEASPSPQASATPLPDFMQLGFRRKGPFFDHPLSFLWPYELRPFGAAQFRLLSAEAPVYNRNAVQLQITSQDTNHTVWIDKANDQVLQVQVDYPDGGRLEVRYTGNYPPDRETGFIFYGQVQCFYYPPSSPIPRDVYLAQLIDPVANVKIATANEPFNPRPIPEKVRPPLFNFKVPPVLSTGLKVVIGLLLAALLVLGYRYARFVVSRQVFSDELILIDEEDGTLGPLLTRLGYSVIPFGPDILTDERQHLGKGATADTTRKPRAVVVAPDSFGEARGYFFLLRAYVEEGGRVLVLPHSPRAANNMPFRPSFIPVVPSDPNTVFVAKAGLWKSLQDHEVERFAASVASKECYLRVNDRALDQEFLVARNKNNGIRGVQLGILKQGKGEYILCQLNLHLKSALADPTARKVLGDLLNYLRGREAPAEEPAVGARTG